MSVGQAVVERLEADAAQSGIGESLALFCRHLDVERVSLHAVDAGAGAFRVVAGGGGEILAPGTVLPLETSTQVLVAARGELLRRPSFDDGEPFDRPLDHLVMDMGYRSGCSIPLFMGSRPVGTLCATSRNRQLNPDPVLDAMSEASLAMTLALHRASASESRVLICIDDELLAQGIARVVEDAAPVSVETYSTAQALNQGERAGSRYEAVICDATFDGLPVDSFLASLRSSGTNSPALVLASNDSPMSRSLAKRGGAAAYVARSAGVDRLASAVRSLMAGDADAFAVPVAAGSGDAEHEIPQLTGQESRILVLLERGLRFKQIALELGISESTAKGYARNLFAKLRAHSRSEAVYVARNRGLLDFLTAAA